MDATKKFINVEQKIAALLFVIVAVLFVSLYFFLSQTHRAQAATLSTTQIKLQKLKDQYDALNSIDQKLRNDKLEGEIASISATYKSSVKTYEQLLKLKEQTNKTDDYDKRFAHILSSLSDKDYASATAQIAGLQNDISKKQAELASAFSIPANVAQINTAPGSGYRRQSVQNEFGTYMVDVIAADLNSTKVVVDTASDSDCHDNCPVMALGDFAARSGAFAAINGPYFCPASYPSCAGKANSFDTLLMNKNKHYFNSDNNVYSTVPAVIFSGGSARYVGQSLEWGRDSSVDAVIANQPLLVSGGNVVFGGDDEAKRSGKGSRSFIGSSGNIVYMGVVYNANVAEVARVLKTMGVQYALNLDSGGSTALWSGGRYVAGPGRSTPFGILFVRK
jgi:exopolysaccharide biosynthesis protein